MRRALEELDAAPGPDAALDLARRYAPDQLAGLAPEPGPAWIRLMDALVPVAPAHADALASARETADPRDPAPLRYRVRLALQANRASLALHHARLLHQLEPGVPEATLLLVAALRTVDARRHNAEIRRVLERQLAADPSDHVDGIEEQLVLAYLEDASQASLEAAGMLLPRLLGRAAPPPDRARRAGLEARLRALVRAMPRG
jgi:hypothetical protein